MTYPVVQHPDVELLLTGWLRTALIVGPATTGPRVVRRLPGNLEQVLPVVQVTRIGGGRTQQMLDRPRVDVDVFALSDEAASDLARRVEALLPSLRGVTTGGGTVGWVGIETGASWKPDWNERVRRYGLTGTFVIRAA